MDATMLSLVGCILAFALLMILIMKNIHILIVALVCVTVVSLFSGTNVYTSIMQPYMTGFVDYFKSYFMLFLVGALFGQVMERSGATHAIAKLFVARLGAWFALLAIVLACAALVYGGISCFVVGFAVIPFAVTLFEEADIPRRFLAGALTFGTVTFAMTGPGTPQVQNIIPTTTLGTKASAGWGVGVIVMIFMFIVGMIWLQWTVNKAKANGEHFQHREGEAKADPNRPTPSGLLALIPLIVSVLALNVLGLPVELAVLTGVILAYIMFLKYLPLKDAANVFSAGFSSALSAIANTCIVVGFGSVVKGAPAFTWLTENIDKIPGPALVGVALSVTLICGITGSASGGIGMAIPAIAPIYVAQGVIPEAIHRVASIASGALDSLPHNGYVVTTLNICGLSHKEGYFPVFMLTVVLPSIGTALAILLFTICPWLPM